LVAVLKPTVPGIATCVIASVNLPIALSSATSSKGLIVSKNFSTSTTVFVSKPKSINSAAKETTPSGTFIKPDAIPATPATNAFVSLGFSSSIRLK